MMPAESASRAGGAAPLGREPVRRAYAAVTLVACLALLFGAAGVMSVTAIRLARAEAVARAEAARQENLRLALWRMDSALAPLIAQERARPYFLYAAFYPADGAYAAMFAPPDPAGVTVPSPLLAADSTFVRLYFQLAPDGSLSSPECPDEAFREQAVSLVGRERLERSAKRLAEFRSRVPRDALLAALPPDAERPRPVLATAAPPDAQRAVARQAEAPQLESADPQQAEQQQRVQNVREYQARSQSFDNLYVQQQHGGAAARPSEDVREGVFRALWVGDALVLARRVSIGPDDYVQGCWLDWDGLRVWLLAQVGDLLVDPKLLPVESAAGDEREHRLAGVPARLVAATAGANAAAAPLRADVRLSLALAWVCAVLAAGALTALLIGALRLSERRAAFVSAVTHELRTPLTTFRLYAEMLADDVVRDEQKRRGYLATLRAEANRLGHLVENVLAYARLERGRSRRDTEAIELAALLSRLTERLAARAEQAGMALCVETCAAGSERVRVNVSAVEQILFNLVDNACKYASRAVDRRIHVRAASGGGQASIEVRDHGPGLGASQQRRLFRPFRKSAREAAESAPGIGLGLALSRRLAQGMGGRLRAAPCADGACFALDLPPAV